MNRNLAFVAIIYDRIGTRIKDVFENDAGNNLAQFFNLNPGAESLLAQLEHVDTEEQINAPPNVGLVIRDVIDDPISELLEKLEDHDSPLEFGNRLQTFFQQHLSFLRERAEAFSKLLTARDPAAVEDAGKGLFSTIFSTLDERIKPWEAFQPFLGTDIGTILPLATIASAARHPKHHTLVSATRQALLAYFFKKHGYKTVDGASVISPIHLSDKASSVTDVGSLKNMLSQARAEHYIRDTIRVTVEAAYDSVRDLERKYTEIVTELKQRQHDPQKKTAVENKFTNWFRGFSSMAESGSMRAVEIGTQGVSEIQTNPLIAAAAGSFAGTVARKISQDSFLNILRSEF